MATPGVKWRDYNFNLAQSCGLPLIARRAIDLACTSV